MKKGKVLWLSIAGAVVLSAALLIGCGGISPFNISTEEDVGVLRISTDAPFQAKTIMPGGDITIDYYVVTITHQVSLATMNQTVSAPPPPEGVEFANIETGMYDILVQGFNVADELLCVGADIALIETNQTTSTTIQTGWDNGPGTLDLTISLNPVDLIYNPVVEGELYDGSTWVPATFTAGSGTWNLTTALDTGYYAIRWQLFSDGDLKIAVAGACEAVFILKDRTSTGSYALDENTITMPPGTGGSIIIIWEPFDSPIPIGFVDPLNSGYTGIAFTLVTTSPAEPLDSYAWYEDGVLIDGEITSTLVWSEIEPGFHNYSVLAQKGDVLCSAEKGIAFTEAPGDPDNIVWTEPSIPVQWAGANGETHPLSVVLYDDVTPILEGTVVYWRIVSADQDYLDTVDLASVSSITDGNGIALNTFLLIGNLNAEHDGNVEVAIDAAFTELLTASPLIQIGTY